jgi:hypothetical protein
MGFHRTRGEWLFNGDLMEIWLYSNNHGGVILYNGQIMGCVCCLMVV